MSTFSAILLLPLVELVLVALLSGCVGALAYLDRKIFFAEAITHGTFPGAVLGVVVAAALGGTHGQISMALFLGAFLFCLPLGQMMRFLARLPGISSQSAAGIVLSFAFALGYFLAKWFAPLPLQVQAFLSGSLLTVNGVDVLFAALALGFALASLLIWGKDLLSFSFDAEDYRARGGNARLANALILGLVVVTIVIVIPAVGTVLSIGLLAAPAAGLAPLLRSTRSFLLLAPLAALGIGLTGFVIGVHANLSVGGTIAIVAAVFYAACRVLAHRGGRRGRPAGTRAEAA